MISYFRLRMLCIVLLVTFVAGSLISPVHATARCARISSGKTPDITPVIDKYRAHIRTAMRREHIPGVAIVVVDDQNVLWQECFGYTDTDRLIPVTPDTPFSIQSGSKSFTALTVLMAVQDGQLDPFRQVEQCDPELASNALASPFPYPGWSYHI